MISIIISSWIALLVSLASHATAVPPSLSPFNPPSKRDENSALVCQTSGFCQSWYQTGSGWCASGYTGSRYEVSGYPQGTVYERICTNDELKTCFTNNCEFYKKECLKASTSVSLCRTALEYCDAPVQMKKEHCTTKNMLQHVKWDDKDKTCHPTVVFRKGATYSLHLYPNVKSNNRVLLSCFPLSMNGVQFLSKRVMNAGNRKDKNGNFTSECEYDELNAYCRMDPEHWKLWAHMAGKYCTDKTESSDGVPPHFMRVDYTRATGRGKAR